MHPVSPADVRGMLRADAIGLGLGVLLLIVGLLTLLLWAVTRRRAASLPPGHRAGGVWLGLFAFLYGLRLLARTETFPLYFGLPTSIWDHVAAAITYMVPLPIIFFMRHFVPARRRFSNAAAVVVTLFAVYAIASDVILGQPDSARTPNNLIAIVLLGVLVAMLFSPGLARSRELRIARIGVLAWPLTAVADNLRGMKWVAFPGPALEPFGFTVLLVCLGTVAAARLLGDARRLVAIDRELSIARQIQFSILPQAMPRVAGVTAAARYRPMAAVAGDFYDFVEIDEQRVGILVADVSGHGVPAGLIASMVKVALAAQEERADHPGAVLTGMNRALFGRLGTQYVTAAYLFIDGPSNLFRYAAAGHPPMLRLTRRSREVREVESNGLALGFAETAEYPELEQSFDGDERLLLYTDGLVEAANAADDFFGLERAKTALVSGAALPPDRAADSLLATVDAWSGQPAGDDVTIVLLDTAVSSALSTRSTESPTDRLVVSIRSSGSTGGS